MFFILKKIYYFFSLLFAIFLLAIQKLVFIRIGYLYRNKIGHLIGNTQIYLYKKKSDKHNFTNNSITQLDLWFSSDKSKYPIIDNYIKKKIIILPSIFLKGVYNLSFKFTFLKKFRIDEHDWGLDYYNLNYKNKSEKLLNKKQIIFAENELKKISIYPKDKIACIITRNDFFNKKIIKDNSLVDFNKHRNSKFENYLLSAKYLTEKGFKVVRLGSHDKNFKSRFVINYTSSKINNNLIDIYLLKKANLIISSGTGIDMVASQLLKKSICYVNLIPYRGINSFRNTPKGVILTKKLMKNKKFLPLKKIIQLNYFNLVDAKSYKKKNIMVVENTKKEILECVKEFYKLNYLDYQNTTKENQLKKKFYQTIDNFFNYKNFKIKSLNYEKNSLANFSTYFLKKNYWFLKD